MTAEFIGSVLPRRESELIPPSGPPLQPAFIVQLARAFERSGVDAVEIGQSATSVDAVVLAQVVLAATNRLGVVVTLPAHLAEPVTAARAVASLAALYPNRVQARVPVTRDDTSQQAEFVQLLHRLLHARTPVDYVGRHYQVRRHWSPIRPEPAPRLQVQLGADPLADIAVAAHADTLFLPAASPAEVATRLARLNDLAGDRPLRFGISVRPIVGATEADVEALSRRVLGSTPMWWFDADPSPSSANHPRALAAVTQACGAAAAFVGPVEVIAERLREYHAAGVRVFHVSGFDPLEDVVVLAQIADRFHATPVIAQQRSPAVADHVA